MKALFSVCLALMLTFIAQGCRQGMDLNPQDYFSGQQLVLAKAIEQGEVDQVKKLAPETDLNKPGQQDMTLLFWALSTPVRNYHRFGDGGGRPAPASSGWWKQPG